MNAPVPAPHANAPNGTEATGAPLALLQVMVIDDQKSMRSILRRMLHALGIEGVHEAGDGREALDMLLHPNAPAVDFIICDLNMRGMDGLTFCNSVRRSHALRDRHLPILILTAEQDEFLLDVVRQVGAADVAHKPISVVDLRRYIEQLVGIAA